MRGRMMLTMIALSMTRMKRLNAQIVLQDGIFMGQFGEVLIISIVTVGLNDLNVVSEIRG
jgi:hypothetical protein